MTGTPAQDPEVFNVPAILERLRSMGSRGSPGDKSLTRLVMRLIRRQAARIEFLEADAMHADREHADRRRALATLEAAHADLSRRYDLLMQRSR